MDTKDVDTKDVDTSEVIAYWSIDLDWYQENKRSFTSLAGERLCDDCRQRRGKGGGEISADDLLASIKECCSQKTGYITAETPILESVFRLFLANGNQPLDLEELSEQLAEWRGGVFHRTSVEILSRLLASDRHYGIRQITD